MKTKLDFGRVRQINTSQNEHLDGTGATSGMAREATTTMRTEYGAVVTVPGVYPDIALGQTLTVVVGDCADTQPA